MPRKMLLRVLEIFFVLLLVYIGVNWASKMSLSRQQQHVLSVLSEGAPIEQLHENLLEIGAKYKGANGDQLVFRQPARYRERHYYFYKRLAVRLESEDGNVMQFSVEPIVFR